MGNPFRRANLIYRLPQSFSLRGKESNIWFDPLPRKIRCRSARKEARILNMSTSRRRYVQILTNQFSYCSITNWLPVINSDQLDRGSSWIMKPSFVWKLNTIWEFEYVWPRFQISWISEVQDFVGSFQPLAMKKCDGRRRRCWADAVERPWLVEVFLIHILCSRQKILAVPHISSAPRRGGRLAGSEQIWRRPYYMTRCTGVCIWSTCLVFGIQRSQLFLAVGISQISVSNGS